MEPGDHGRARARAESRDRTILVVAAMGGDPRRRPAGCRGGVRRSAGPFRVRGPPADRGRAGRAGRLARDRCGRRTSHGRRGAGARGARAAGQGGAAVRRSASMAAVRVQTETRRLDRGYSHRRARMPARPRPSVRRPLGVARQALRSPTALQPPSTTSWPRRRPESARYGVVELGERALTLRGHEGDPVGEQHAGEEGIPAPRVAGATDTRISSRRPASANCPARSPPPTIHTSCSPALAAIRSQASSTGPRTSWMADVATGRSREVNTTSADPRTPPSKRRDARPAAPAGRPIRRYWSPARARRYVRGRRGMRPPPHRLREHRRATAANDRTSR